MESPMPDEQEFKRKENIRLVRMRIAMWMIVALLIGLAPWLALQGKYGSTLFLTTPFSVGLLLALLKSFGRKNKMKELLLIMIFPVLLIAIIFLVVGKEGFICILMAIPIVVGPMVLGVATGYLVQNFYWSKYVAMIFVFMLNTSMYMYDSKKKSDFETQTITTTIVIHAPKEKVWEKLVHHFEFGSADNFFLEHGVSYPLSMELQNSSGCSSLLCQYSNGLITGKIDSLIPGSLMRFSFSDAPVSMKETSLYSDVEPKHIRGKVIIDYGSFRIVPLNGGDVEVIATSEFRSSLGPHFYWNWWGAYLVDKMHEHVLEKIKEKSEGPQ
jgi:hypothetical protein